MGLAGEGRGGGGEVGLAIGHNRKLCKVYTSKLHLFNGDTHQMQPMHRLPGFHGVHAWGGNKCSTVSRGKTSM